MEILENIFINNKKYFIHNHLRSKNVTSFTLISVAGAAVALLGSIYLFREIEN